MNTHVKEHEYACQKAITLTFGTYSAMLLPEVGGNLVSFKDEARGFSFLRTPSEVDMDVFTSYPVVYGIPVLFPPNRYEDGTFALNGITYQFPVNEASTDNHLHGFLYDIPWSVKEMYSTNEAAIVVLQQVVEEDHPMYQFFPHRFTMELEYCLSKSGLEQYVRIHNQDDKPMPCMLAFHTTLNVPFVESSTIDDYKIEVTIGERWELNERMLPTGKHKMLESEETQMKEDGVFPFFNPMDNHYTSSPKDGRNYVALKDAKAGIQLVYDVGTSYKNWMIWNNEAKGGYICPEPQINLVNAPNVNLPDEAKGFVNLMPGESWAETSRFYVEGI